MMPPLASSTVPAMLPPFAASIPTPAEHTSMMRMRIALHGRCSGRELQLGCKLRGGQWGVSHRRRHAEGQPVGIFGDPALIYCNYTLLQLICNSGDWPGAGYGAEPALRRYRG